MSWEQIPGWFGFRAMYDRAVEEAPQEGAVFVEVGVAFGKSLAYLANRVIASGKQITVYGVDPWRDDWWMPPNDYPTDAPRPTWGGEYAEWARELGGPFSAFLHAMSTRAPQELEFVRPLRLYSKEAARLFSPGCVDFALIDGNHNYAQVVSDIREWLPLVKPGGILAGDDYHEGDFPGVTRAVREAFPLYNVEDRTWWVRK